MEGAAVGCPEGGFVVSCLVGLGVTGCFEGRVDGREEGSLLGQLEGFLEG